MCLIKLLTFIDLPKITYSFLLDRALNIYFVLDRAGYWQYDLEMPQYCHSKWKIYITHFLSNDCSNVSLIM